MTRNATGSLSSGKPDCGPRMAACAAIGLLSCVSSPAMAQDVVTDEDVSVGDVMLTPLNDLNIRQDPIPPVLVRAHMSPYDDTKLTDCAHVLQEIGNLDAVLGEDFDTANRVKQGGSTEKIAQSVLVRFIPFRGVIRQLSGANLRAAEFREAITAGLARRAYLKGLGQGMGCKYPARPAPPGLMVHPETEDGSHGSHGAGAGD